MKLSEVFVHVIWEFLDPTSRRFVKMSSKMFSSLSCSNVINHKDFILPLSEEMILWLLKNKFPYDYWIIRKLISLNNPDLLITAIKNGYSIPLILYKDLIIEDNISIIKRFYEENIPISREWLIESAVYDSIRCFIYSCSCGIIFDNEILKIAIRNKSHQCVKFMLSIDNLSKDCDVMIEAVIYGNIELLDNMHKLGYPLCDDLFYYASINGKIECMKYLKEHGIETDYITVIRTAAFGEIESLKYLVEIGHTLDINAAAVALKREHFSCFEFILQHGIKWNIKYTLDIAQYIVSEKPLNYLIDHNYPINYEVFENARMTGYSNHTLHKILRKLDLIE